jgi:ATP synthase protein I
VRGARAVHGSGEAGLGDQSDDAGPGGFSDERKSLDNLDARLRAAQARELKAEGVGEKNATTSGLGVGLRIGVEMVAGLGVGLAIGWGLDRWWGTKPIMMILFFFLGAAAGILNAYRASSGMDDSVGFGAAKRRRDEKKREK